MKFSKQVFFFVLFLLPYFIHAQVPMQSDVILGDTTQLHLLQTAEGDQHTGVVLSFDGEGFVFLIENGSELTFSKQEVRDIYLVGEDGGVGKKLFPQRYYNQQHLFFSPTAFVMEKGTKKWRTIGISNFLDYGLSDHVTIGVGVHSVIVASGLSGKVRIGGSLSKYIHIAVGAEGIVYYTPFGGEAMGLFYSTLSLGTKEKFLSVGIGQSRIIYNDEVTTGVTLGGSYRTGNHWRMYFEYLYFREDRPDSPFIINDPNDYLGTFGCSWFKGQHQIDFALMFQLGNGGGAAPVATYSLRF